MGRLFSIASRRDLETIRFDKKEMGRVLSNPGLCSELTEQLVSW